MDKNIKYELLNLAEHYFQSNNYPFAKHFLQKIIKDDSNHSRAHELLAYISGNEGDLDSSFNHLIIACSSEDYSAEAIYYLGTQQLKKKLYVDALSSFEKSILRGGEFFEVLHDLGITHANLGNFQDAIIYFKKCLIFNRNSQNVYLEIARCEEEKKCFDKALLNYEKAIEISPNYAEAWCYKGTALHQLSRYDEALKNYEQALQINPNYAEAFCNKGVTLHQITSYDEALKNYEQALQIKPNYAEAWLNMGVTFYNQNHFSKAIICYEKAIEINPNLAEAYSNKGSALHDLKKYEEAIPFYEKAIQLQPNLRFVFGDLLHTRMKLCDWQSFEKSTAFCNEKIKELLPITHPFPLLSIVDNQLLQATSSNIYCKVKLPSHQPKTTLNRLNTSKKIKIGYFSSDFRDHPVSQLLVEILENHNQDNFEVFGFYYGPKTNDELQKRIKQSFKQFYILNDFSNSKIVSLSNEIGIDIALDLNGHTQNARTEIFLNRCAPIQINYLGYPGTIGSNSHDYIIADKIVIPECNMKYFSEKIIYLPNSFLPPNSKKTISNKKLTREEFNLPINGFVFCCFNNIFKITPDIFDVWAEILKATPNSVLWLPNDNPLACQNLQKEIIKRGINSQRLVFSSRAGLHEEYLKRYQLADLFLDTHPFGAHTTAVDALWAELPVLTYTGKSFPNRVASSLLNSLGIRELITESLEHYKLAAIHFAKNPDLIIKIKNKLKLDKLNAPIFDTTLYAQNLNRAFEVVYSNFVANQAPKNFEIN
jgi:predicted O-linked N-acetylglucosamine transferase (SPINDLY family)